MAKPKRRRKARARKPGAPKPRPHRRLGAHLRRKREEAKLSKMGVVHSMPFTQSHLQKIERGELDIKFSTLEKFAVGYRMTMSQLMEGWEDHE